MPSLPAILVRRIFWTLPAGRNAPLPSTSATPSRPDAGGRGPGAAALPSARWILAGIAFHGAAPRLIGRIRNGRIGRRPLLLGRRCGFACPGGEIGRAHV